MNAYYYTVTVKVDGGSDALLRCKSNVFQSREDSAKDFIQNYMPIIIGSDAKCMKATKHNVTFKYKTKGLTYICEFKQEV